MLAFPVVALGALGALVVGLAASIGLGFAVLPTFVTQVKQFAARLPTVLSQADRYLLGGTWLYRADPGNVGLSQGWGAFNFSTSGWSSVTIPNSFNAGDLSNQSWEGSIGWYRRDFTLPAGAFPAIFSAAGIVLIVVTIMLGFKMVGRL